MGRRGRRKQSRAEAHRRELPPDIIFTQILPRLPVKSLFRFKSVSKQWQSFLTTPAFSKMQLHHAATTNLVALSAQPYKIFTEYPYDFLTIDCERPEIGFSASRRLPFKVGPGQIIRILTSVHGLVCIGIWPRQGMCDQYSDLVLWNPTTRDHKTLSKPLTIFYQEDYYNKKTSLFGLWHSSWDDDYKLVCVTLDTNNVYIYSLKSDSWRKVESGFQHTRRMDDWSSYFWGPIVSLNENLYFLELISNQPYSIMKFNAKTETLKVIATPFSRDGRTTWLSFTKRDGCIELWVNIRNPLNSSVSVNELWRMEGDGNWTKVENSGTNLNYPRPEFYHERLHLMRSGHLLMFDLCENHVYQIDIMKTHMRTLCSNTQGGLRVWPQGKHIETMVSPNQYVKQLTPLTPPS